MAESVGVYMEQKDTSSGNYGLVYLCEECAGRLGETVQESRKSYSSENAVCKECGMSTN